MEGNALHNNTHFIYGYYVSDIIMVKAHSDSKRGNPLPSPQEIRFPRSIKDRYAPRAGQAEGGGGRGVCVCHDHLHWIRI